LLGLQFEGWGREQRGKEADLEVLLEEVPWAQFLEAEQTDLQGKG
jgi:hypothetical protein